MPGPSDRIRSSASPDQGDGVHFPLLLTLLAVVVVCGQKIFPSLVVLEDGTVETLGGSMKDAKHRNAILPRIAYMPQGLGKNLYMDLTVRENLEFFGRLFGQGKRERDERIARLVAATGLDPFTERPAGKLSGGMKQKLGLCCALIHDPDILILDEPTTGVDPLSRQQFWQLIDAIRQTQSQMTVLVATAYMDEAARFDRLIAMNDGKVLATGTGGRTMPKGRPAHAFGTQL